MDNLPFGWYVIYDDGRDLIYTEKGKLVAIGGDRYKRAGLGVIWLNEEARKIMEQKGQLLD